MSLTRRGMLGLAFAAAGAVGLPLAGRSERFSDQSGLSKGRFIWQGAVDGSGPVLIVVSLSQRIAHVYRGTELLGISTCEFSVPAQAMTQGVFRLMPQQGGRDPGAGSANPAAWRAIAISILTTGDPQVRRGVVRLPGEFAALLSDETWTQGGILVIAGERTVVEQVGERGPLLEALGRARALSPAVAGWVSQRGQHVGASPLSLVASRRDGVVYAVRGEGFERVGPLDLSGSAASIGAHAYLLASAATFGARARWLGLGLGQSPDDAHIRRWMGEDVLDRVSIGPSDVLRELSRDLYPGAVLVVTDAALGEHTRRAAQRPFILLADAAHDLRAAPDEASGPIRPTQPRTRVPSRGPARDQAPALAPEMFIDPTRS